MFGQNKSQMLFDLTAVRGRIGRKGLTANTPGWQARAFSQKPLSTLG